MNTLRNRKRGVTLIETMVSIAVLGFIMSFSSFLVFLTGRNMLNVRDQIMSQTSAASAQERVVYMLRNAQHFALVANDSPVSNVLSRVHFIVPQYDGSVRTSTLAWDSSTKELKYFEDGTALSWDSNDNPIGTATRAYANMSDFGIIWENRYRLNLGFYFDYKGFGLALSNPGNPQYGQFITDVVAKNHFVYKDTDNYGDDDVTSSPFRLGA